ncbi:MAG: hypothetical protein RL148_506 [Planctomycetota bacterium]
MGDAANVVDDVVQGVQDIFGGGASAARTVTDYREQKKDDKAAKKAEAAKRATLLGQMADRAPVERRAAEAGAASLMQGAVGAPGGTEPMVTTRPAAKKATMLGGRPNLLG